MKIFCLYTLLGWFASLQCLCAEKEPVKDADIQKVYVIFKTHLDVGFTDWGSKVIDTYTYNFIPAVLNLSEEIMKDSLSQIDYPWTCGSWLIWNYLERASNENGQRMKEAIDRGDFTWHAMPFTMQVELCDSAMLSAALNISKKLDLLFGGKTIAAKITDVPGVTRGAISVLKRNGIQLLHVGTNPGAAVARFPEIFRWKNAKGDAINVIYQSDYGKPVHLPGTKTAAVFCFTHDNHGPHSLKEIKRIYAGLKQKYPSARIIPSSLNEVALELSKVENSLPVVTQEWGDTWIYGIGSDPMKVAQFRQLMRLRNQWIQDGKLKVNSEMDTQFCIPLLLMAEHTWGVDVKWYLRNFDKYQFDLYPSFLDSEEARYSERSWSEKREYIYQAISKLTPALQYEAMQALMKLVPVKNQDTDFRSYRSKAKINTPFFRFAFNQENGTLCYLEDKQKGIVWVDDTQGWGDFVYQRYSGSDFAHFIDRYCPKNPEGWMLADYGKTGLDKLSVTHGIWSYKASDIRIKKEVGQTTVRIRQQLNEPVYGAPEYVEIIYVFPYDSPDIKVEINWFDKPKNRVPEAVWFSFFPKACDSKVYVDKMGERVDVEDVVYNGARQIHGVTGDVLFSSGKGKLSLESLDAPLVAFNNRDLLSFDNKVADPDAGIHFCLLNTLWGTNYPQWFGDNMKYRFKLKFY